VPSLRRTSLISACGLAACLAAPAAAAAQGAVLAPSANGGAAIEVPLPAPAARAQLAAGRAVAPAGAPPQVVAAIEAANRIVGRPYRYGGGHRSFEDRGYDCSGAVSYALRGAGLLATPLDSSSFMSWGVRGRGRWITVFTNPGHAYVVIAGLRFDTSLGDRRAARPVNRSGTGPRWGGPRSPQGFVARHPVGL
jgi:hypothetical protein